MVSETGVTTDPSRSSPSSLKKVLCLCEDRSTATSLSEHLGPSVQVVPVRSLARAIVRLAGGEFDGIYAEADHFTPAADATQLLHNVQILSAMPDGIVLLDRDSQITWGNARIREWVDQKDVRGKNFYQMLGITEILGPETKPFETTFHTGQPTASTLRYGENRFYRIHAAPVLNFEGKEPEHIVVTLREVTDEQQERQKLAAIHQAGIELSDLLPEEVASMGVEERIDLLKENILQGTQDVLHYDVVEIRMLDEATGELNPLLASGIKPEAVGRPLCAATSDNGITGYVAASGSSYLCEDTSEDPLYLEGAVNARSSLTIPLQWHDRTIGTFNVESAERGAFSKSDRQFLEIFCRDVAAALNTMELLAAEKATTAAASVEAIHSAVALPVDDILNDAVNAMEGCLGSEPEIVERLQRILTNARDIKKVIQKVGQSLSPIAARPACVRPEERPLLAGRRILVVDADGTVRSSAHDLLEPYGCVVETAHDGKEAMSMARNLGLDATRAANYDAILADIRLPDMSGYELLMNLKERVENPPLILMTAFGYDPGHTIVKARQAGLKAVLYKPFRLDQLLETIEQAITGHLPAK